MVASSDSISYKQVLGINMAVGIDGSIGKQMIREGREVHLFVRRSLRDVFRKVPTFGLEVKVTTVPITCCPDFMSSLVLHGRLCDYEFLLLRCFLLFPTLYTKT